MQPGGLEKAHVTVACEKSCSSLRKYATFRSHKVFASMSSQNHFVTGWIVRTYSGISCKRYCSSNQPTPQFASHVVRLHRYCNQLISSKLSWRRIFACVPPWRSLRRRCIAVGSSLGRRMIRRPWMSGICWLAPSAHPRVHIILKISDAWHGTLELPRTRMPIGRLFGELEDVDEALSLYTLWELASNETRVDFWIDNPVAAVIARHRPQAAQATGYSGETAKPYGASLWSKCHNG
jgi:hypothetical protein